MARSRSRPPTLPNQSWLQARPARGRRFSRDGTWHAGRRRRPNDRRLEVLWRRPGTGGSQLQRRPGRDPRAFGENGAGKSTILKILNGVHVPDEGAIEVAGVRRTEHSPEAARRAGIG